MFRSIAIIAGLSLATSTGYAAAGRLPAPTHGPPEMVAIPAGTFRMGAAPGTDEDAEPAHDVAVQPFALGRTEVTVAQFRAFVKATGYRTDAERGAGGEQGCFVIGAGPIKARYLRRRSWRDPGFSQRSDHPVVCVSWNDAVAYVRWLSAATHRRFRLPSEAEWEYAARAGDAHEYPWGEDNSRACLHANVADLTPGRAATAFDDPLPCRDGHHYTAPVASYTANAFGVYDTTGNAWEWTQDCDNPGYAAAPADARARLTGNCERRIFRGGGWYDDLPTLRRSFRNRSDAIFRSSYLGFRVAEDAQ